MNDIGPWRLRGALRGPESLRRDATAATRGNPPKIDKAMRDAWDKAKAEGRRPPDRSSTSGCTGTTRSVGDYFVSVEGI